MKTKFFLGAAAVATLMTACSQEELVSVNNNADGILFGVTSGNTTRANASYCNTGLPENFEVIANYADTNDLYFKTTATKSGESSTYVAGNYYWPESALDFTAHVNGGSNFQMVDGVAKFVEFQPAAGADQQLDLLYAQKFNQSRTVVNLNFRHALSQVVFRAKNTSTDLKVTISEVKINHLNTQGTFEFANENTDENYVNHTDEGAAKDLPGQGTWNNLVGDGEFTTTAFTPIEVNNDVTPLTTVAHDAKGDLSMILLPQHQDAWVPANKEDKGAYFAVKVKFEQGSKVIYDNWAYIPVEINWNQGVRYIYTFTFADGNTGGYTDPKDPQDVLSAITFDVTTDDFMPAEKTDVPMDKTEGQGEEVTEKTSVITLNNGVNATPATQELEGKTTGENCTVALPATAPVSSDDTVEFGGWQDAQGNVYQPGATVTVPAGENLTLNAIWNDAMVTYTVTFNVGKWGTGSFDPIVVKAKKGQSVEVQLPATEPTNVGDDESYYFLGWSTKYEENVLQYGTDEPDPTYYTRSKISVSGNMTLYAVYYETSSGSMFNPGGEDIE